MKERTSQFFLKYVALLMIAIVLLLYVYAATPLVAVTSPNGSSTRVAQKVIGAETPQLDMNNPYLRGTVDINFTFSDSNIIHSLLQGYIWRSADKNRWTTLLAADNNVLNAAVNNVGGTTGFACDTNLATAANSCRYAWDTTTATDGNYIVDVNVFSVNEGGAASDLNGTDNSDFNLHVDNTSPDVNFVSLGATNTIENDTITLSWTFADNGGGTQSGIFDANIELTRTGPGASTIVDANRSKGTTLNHTYTSLATGTYTARLFGRDRSGNLNLDTISFIMGSRSGDIYSTCGNIPGARVCPPPQICADPATGDPVAYKTVKDTPYCCEFACMTPTGMPLPEVPEEMPEMPKPGMPSGGAAPSATPPEDLCAGVNCNDMNPCTRDRCDPATGSCVVGPVEKGTPCGTGMVCENGNCVPVKVPAGAAPGQPSAAAAPIDPVVVVVVVGVIGLAAWLFLAKPA